MCVDPLQKLNFPEILGKIPGRIPKTVIAADALAKLRDKPETRMMTDLTLPSYNHMNIEGWITDAAHGTKIR